MKKSLKYTIDVLTHSWSVYYLPKQAYIKVAGERSIALADVDERDIYLRIDKIRKSKIAKESIRHELAHAYIHEGNATVSSLTAEQMEEFCCEVVAKYGKRIHDQADAIINAYNVSTGKKIK